MSMVKSYFTNLLLNKFKDRLLDTIEESEVKKQLEIFIESKKKINEYSDISEEIDFKGLVDYIDNISFYEFEKCILGKNEERKLARECIINKAIAYSNANTTIKKKKVTNFISDIIGIFKEFYRRKGKDFICVANEIKDDISNTERNIIGVIKENNNNFLSIEKNLELVKSEKINDVESNINTFMKCMGNEHKLYPDYHFEPTVEEGKIGFISKPASIEAIKKYPPVIECSGYISIGTKSINEFDGDIINYANRHQLPIRLNVQEAKKKLGDIDDPIQSEAEKLIGEEFIIPPKPFLGPFPSIILVDDEVICEYILVKTEEILDDGTKVISNKGQDGYPLIITFKVNISNNTSNISVKIRNYSNEARLKYACFMKALSEGKKFVARFLESGTNFLELSLDKHEYKSDFETIDKEIDFFEKVIAIEKYFNKAITIPETILLKDFEVLSYMANLIKGESTNGNWSELYLNFALDENIKNKISDMGENLLNMLFVGNINICLFDQEYEFNIKRIYKKAKVKNLEKLKRKIEVLDNGDTFKIEYIAGEEDGCGSYVDKLNETNIKKI